MSQTKRQSHATGQRGNLTYDCRRRLLTLQLWQQVH
jgi:hypothetical protein